MGVLACERAYCNNIMCTRLILNHKMYICDDCWRELVVYKNTWPANMSKNDVRDRIENFMNNTRPGTYTELETKEEIEEEFKRLTNTD